jgi:hypothetical protein
LLPALKDRGGKAAASSATRRRELAAGPSAATPSHHGGGFSPLVPAIVLAPLALALAAGRRARARRRTPSGGELLAELERAFARAGRPIAGGVTLAALEHRLRAAPEAAAYVRAIRLSRYGARPTAPSSAGRRALRAQLCAGLGTGGRLRALWALPPRVGW